MKTVVPFQGTTLPDKFSHVWLNATPWPLTQLRNTSCSWRTFFKPWLSSFLSLEDSHLVAFNYIPLGNFVYILIIYSTGSPMIMEKCFLISLSSYAYGLLMLMVTKCLPIEESEWYFDLLQWGDTQSSADTDLCPVRSISIALFMAEVPYLCVSFTVMDRSLTNSTLHLGWGHSCGGRAGGLGGCAEPYSIFSSIHLPTPCQWHTPTWQQKEMSSDIARCQSEGKSVSYL